MLNLCFLGKLKFEYEGYDITEKIGAKTAALIVLLMLNPKRGISREKAISYLWPDSNEEAAKYNLRYNLWILKKNIAPDASGEQFLKIDKDYCSINFKYDFQCDVLNIIRFDANKSYTIKNLIELKTSFLGDFFEGHYFNNCDDFNELIIFARNNFEKQKIKILKKLELMYEEEKNFDACLDIINEILNIDPYDEDLALKAMCLYIRCRDRGGAIKFYKSFSNKLTCSLGIQPSELLLNKYNEIKNNKDLEVQESKLKEKSSSCETNEHMRHIKIETLCVNTIEYFWMAEVVNKFMENHELQWKNAISRYEILDLAYIIPDVVIYCNMDCDRSIVVPAIRITNAFISLIKSICDKYILHIKINDSENMDKTSLSILEYLRKSNIKNLSLEST